MNQKNPVRLFDVTMNLKSFVFLTFIFLQVQACSTSPTDLNKESARQAESKSDGKRATPTEKARLLVQVANAALQEGDVSFAFEKLAEASRYDDSVPEIHHSRSLGYLARNELTEALDEVRLAVKLHPEYAEANTTMGKILMDLGRQKEAIPHLEKAAKNPVYKDSYKPLTLLGVIYYRMNMPDSALTNLTHAIDLSPMMSCLAYYYRGHIWLSKGASGISRAIGDYEKSSTKICAGFGDAHFALGLALSKQKDFSRARKKFLEVRERFPETAFAKRALQELEKLP